VAHTGELAALWPLIGERVQAVSWADDIDIVFTGGARLRIPASPDHAPRGTLLGRAGDNHLAEDF
jgi:hypothetical protein